MSNFMDEAHRLTQQQPLARLLDKRCLSERDLSASCTTCADVCPAGAIVLEGVPDHAVDPYGSVSKDQPTGPRIDEEACMRCGRCIVACPTAALVAATPYDDDALLNAGSRAAAAAVAQAAATRATREQAAPRENEDEGEGEGAAATLADEPIAVAGFACTATARTLRIDAERTVALPCLAWVDEALLLHVACAGAQRVTMPTCACTACEQATAVEALPATVAHAQAIADIWGIDTTFQLVEADDGGLAAAEATAVGEVSRRDLLSQAGSALADAAAEAAAVPIREFAGIETVAHAEGAKPDRRRWQLLDDLHAFGLPGDDSIVVPRCLAPRVDINVDRCSGCALCAQFCPTGALRKAGKAPGGKTVLEFDASLCRDCGVCTETCRYEALSCEEALTAAELFAFEPRAMVIPKRRVLPSRR